MSDYVIKVENLGKKYKIRHQPEHQKYVALRDIIANKAKNIGNWALGRSEQLFSQNGNRTKHLVPNPNSGASEPLTPEVSRRTLSSEDFWALRNVSFEVNQGEVVGIIGRNGAGKSTLLKILSRITKPTEGQVRIRGRVASLLEVGTGFHPELTGRENVFLNGAVLGMSRKEIGIKFDDIVSFAEVEKFIDTPVKRYSSGMYVRLAFAVAAHLDPEILIIDEVLAVGDLDFQKKCLGRMGEVAKHGRTVLFVSHNMVAVRDLCTRALYLEEGQVGADDEVHVTVSQYLTKGSNILLDQNWPDPNKAPGNENVRILLAQVAAQEGGRTDYLTIESQIQLIFKILNLNPRTPLHFNLLLYNEDNICVFNTWSQRKIWPKGQILASCHIPAHFLNEGTYTMWFLVHYVGIEGANIRNILTFEVYDTESREAHGWYGKVIGVTRPQLQWELKSL